MDNCSRRAHGTHVAGIIGAEAMNISENGFAPNVPFVGVAPQAIIGACKPCVALLEYVYDRCSPL
jgi:subtilisin family serine protease